MAFEGDEDGLVEELENALLVIRDDYNLPTQEDLEGFYDFMSKLNLFDYNQFRKECTAVEVEITQGQLDIIRERNEW